MCNNKLLCLLMFTAEFRHTLKCGPIVRCGISNNNSKCTLHFKPEMQFLRIRLTTYYLFVSKRLLELRITQKSEILSGDQIYVKHWMTWMILCNSNLLCIIIMNDAFLLKSLLRRIRNEQGTLLSHAFPYWCFWCCCFVT